jgi:hypothetical protein
MPTSLIWLLVVSFLFFSKRHTPQYEGENAALVQAMDAVLDADNPENRKKMYEVLLTSRLLIPTPELPAHSNQDNDVKVDFPWITDKWGRKLIPVFTDIEVLRNWDPNTPMLAFQAQTFFKLTLKYGPGIQGVVINPIAPNATKMIRPMAIIASGEFEVLARGAIPHDQGAGLVGYQLPNSSFGIQPPNQTLPTAALEVLSNSASRFQEIASLYVFSVAQADGAPQLTVGVQLDGGITKEREQLIVQTLWRAVVPSLIQTEVKNLDFAVLNGQIAAQVEHNGSKIYSRP